MGETADEAQPSLRASVEQVPVEIRDQWERHLSETVSDMWARPTLSPRYRSIVSVAALATRGSDAELRHQILVALELGLSRVELCEVMMQVTGYGGLGTGVDGMIALREVFEANPSLGDEPADLPGPMAGDTRWERSRSSFTAVIPDMADMLSARDSEYAVETPAADRPPFDPTGPEWSSWIRGVSYGEFWSRGVLTLAERELVTSAVIIVLGRDRELHSHLRAALVLGLSRQEVAEAIMHLAVYLGFPTAVEAMLQFQRVLVGKDMLQAHESDHEGTEPRVDG